MKTSLSVLTLFLGATSVDALSILNKSNVYDDVPRSNEEELKMKASEQAVIAKFDGLSEKKVDMKKQ